MLFDSKPMDDQAYQEEQRRRLEASKNNRKIDNELGWNVDYKNLFVKN